MKIIAKKSQKTKEKDIPTGDIVASYVESLKTLVSDEKVNNMSVKKVINSLPPPTKIRSELSKQEIAIVFESVRYAWKEVSGQDIIEENKIRRSPETLNGNYWMIKNGIILEGPNHFTIIRKHMDLLASLLNIDPFVIHEKMSGTPNGLIKTIIDNGGMRIFVNKARKAFFQLSDKTYSEWGRDKIKKYDFKDKIVKVIDSRQPYCGWESGVLILL